jgi:hypothetical protein
MWAEYLLPALPLIVGSLIGFCGLWFFDQIGTPGRLLDEVRFRVGVALLVASCIATAALTAWLAWLITTHRQVL